MSTLYQYSLLQYHHLRREEWLTLGVLVLFPEQKQIRFLCPQKLRRLRDAFPDAPDKLLVSWLKGFEWQAENLNKTPEIFANHHLEHQNQKLISEYFLPPDSSALQFSSVKSAVLYTEDIEVICRNLSELFFSVYEQDGEDYGQKDNVWLAGQYRKYLRERNPEVLRLHKVQEGYVTEYRERKYKFEFAWQNHTFNLVKAVSLDLKRPDTIQRKGEQYFGQFSLLRDYAAQEHARFDLLIARPTNRLLYRAYDRAVEDIRSAGNVEIIEDDGLSAYAERTIAELVFHEN
jgi:hypothetical protein